MDDRCEQILAAVNEIRDLIRVMAEPQIAARDQKLREELLRIVGKSVQKQKSVLLMDGSHTQLTIRKDTGMNQGNLSTLVKTLSQHKLLVGDTKQPKLAITILPNFFDEASN
jgi:hypothetical protein